MAYQVILKSTDKVSGTNNDAYFHIDWTLLLPKQVNKCNMQYAMTMHQGDYTDKSIEIQNADFELPDLPTNTRKDKGNMTEAEREECVWNVTGSIGITDLLGGIEFTQPYPSSTQAGYFYGSASAIQDIFLYAGNYTLSYYLSQRLGPYDSNNPSNSIEVYLDDVLQTTSTPSSQTSWDLFSVTITASQDATYTLRFKGTSEVYTTTGIDSVSITYDSPLNITVANADFELPDLPTNTRKDKGNMTEAEREECVWNVTGSIGITDLLGGVDFTQPYPSSTQAGYFYGSNSAIQDVFLYAGNYTLSYYLSRRLGAYGSNNPPNSIEVYLNDALQTISTPSSQTSWDLFSVTITATQDATYTLRFQGTSTIYTTTGIDSVSITRQTSFPSINTATMELYLGCKTSTYNNKIVGFLDGNGDDFKCNLCDNPSTLIHIPSQMINVKMKNTKTKELLTEAEEDDCSDWMMTLYLTPI